MNEEVQTYSRLKNNLAKMKLNEFSAHLDEYIDEIDGGNKTFIQSLLELTELELEEKEKRVMQSCVRTAGFPYVKTLEDFDFSFQPTLNKTQILGFKTMRFIDQAENIMFIGSPGVGKTHLSVSIGIEAAKDHRSIRFVTCSDLMMNLKKAQMENCLETSMKYYSHFKLLIIDEVGFLSLDDQGSKLFFQLISRRYEKHSTIITTNKPLSEWGDIFGDPVLANAILDRLLHHCQIIKIIGRSYRTKDYQKELQKKAISTSNTGIA